VQKIHEKELGSVRIETSHGSSGRSVGLGLNRFRPSDESDDLHLVEDQGIRGP